MTNSKNTKRALYVSILSMLLCVAMLIGSTFAWFTDSVSTGLNQIVAGNLDVELEYAKPDPGADLTAQTWSSVQDKTDLFAADALWEPGHTEVVYLRVSNQGTLALDYKLLAYAAKETLGTNVNGDPFKLSEHLKFAVVDLDATKTAFASRDAAVAAVDDSFALGTYPLAGNGVETGVSKYVALVVFMPTTVGNVANYLTGTAVPTVDLAIRLEATQAEFENDSFGNDYDADADGMPDHPEFGEPIETVETQPGALTTNVGEAGAQTVAQVATVTAGGVEVTYAEGVKLAEKSDAASGERDTADATQGLVYTGTASEYGITVGQGNTLGVYELTLPAAEDNTVLIKVVKNVGRGQTIKAVWHNDTKLTQGEPDASPVSGDGGFYTYNSATGDLTIWVLHASEISVEFQGLFASGNGTVDSPFMIETVAHLANIPLQGYDKTYYYKLANNIVVNPEDTKQYTSGSAALVSLTRNAVLDGAGKTITMKAGEDEDTSYSLFYRIVNSTIQNLNVVLNGANLANETYYTVTFDNVDLSGSLRVGGNIGAYVIYARAANLTFKNCVSSVDMQGSGIEGNYNAVFVGYPYAGEAVLTFINCENAGNLTCGKAAMFVGNSSQPPQITYNITNCVNSGTIRSTYVANNYVPNWYIAVAAANKPYIVNGTTYYSETLPNFTEDSTVENTGTVANGPVDTGMTLTRNPDDTFTINPANIEGKTVDHYVVSVGIYTTWLGQGTNRNYATETIKASSTAMTSQLKYLSFVDQTWVTNNRGAVPSDLAGNKIYTLDGVSYYMIRDNVDETLNGKVTAPQMVSVSAYDADDNLLASASLEN